VPLPHFLTDAGVHWHGNLDKVFTFQATLFLLAPANHPVYL
jgi:hypothetical protein